ncbi:MAG: CoA transferase [Rhodobacteraceae bacterium]|nr:CoA transferase [Paracoccaceae bacterium]PHR55892.1 MAG: carnitine dehydratase [Robiginitomaculum sp.]
MAATGPLTGLKVIAVEQAVAAPFCTARLADAGASVTKIERPEGDFARGYDGAAAGLSSYFVWLNRGKSSQVVDLSTDAGKAQLEELIASADVLVQNLRHGALARMGFDESRLQRDFPRLITCAITGYGQTGPMADRKAYDLLVQAEAGLCSLTGSPDGPSRVGLSIADIATGATAYSAILEALIARGINGKGVQISVSMFDVMADWLTVPLLNHEAGRSPKRNGMSHPSIAPYGSFKTKDGFLILVAIQSDREWRKMCKTFLNAPQIADDPRFATNIARVANRSVTDNMVAAKMAQLTKDAAIELLLQADVALASVNDMQGLSDHPHLRRITVQTQNGPVSYPAPAPIFAATTREYGPVPALDERQK